MITKEGENPGKVGQGVTLSNTPHQQKQKPEEGLKAGAPNASLELPLDQLALGSREGPGSQAGLFTFRGLRMLRGAALDTLSASFRPLAGLG